MYVKKIDFPSQITITFLGDIKHFKSKEETTQKCRTKIDPLGKTGGKINVAYRKCRTEGTFELLELMV